MLYNYVGPKNSQNLENRVTQKLGKLLFARVMILDTFYIICMTIYQGKIDFFEISLFCFMSKVPLLVKKICIFTILLS